MSDELPILTPDMAPVPPVRSLQQIARSRIKHWIASTGTTQTYICEVIGRNQPWLSRYLSGGIDADVDTLAAMAKVFDHSLFALLSIPADPDDATVIKWYRALRPTARKVAIAWLREMSRDPERGPSQ
jgi:transcriptional regulator with XRE-family HTH domain